MSRQDYEKMPDAELVAVVRIAMDEGCIHPCHVYDAVDVLLERVMGKQGDAARMREALEAAKAAFESGVLGAVGNYPTEERRGRLDEIYHMVKNALAAPPSESATDCNQLNAAKMREALEHVEKLAREFAAGNYYLSDFPKMLLDAIRPALAAPPRNCDLGRDYILDALKRERNVDPTFTVRLVVDFVLSAVKRVEE